MLTMKPHSSFLLKNFSIMMNPVFRDQSRISYFTSSIYSKWFFSKSSKKGEKKLEGGCWDKSEARYIFPSKELFCTDVNKQRLHFLINVSKETEKKKCSMKAEEKRRGNNGGTGVKVVDWWGLCWIMFRALK